MRYVILEGAALMIYLKLKSYFVYCTESKYNDWLYRLLEISFQGSQMSF